MASKADYETQSNAYELFILVLTILSLVIMVALLLPTLSKSTTQLLEIYDNVICFVFLLDFGLRWTRLAGPARLDTESQPLQIYSSVETRSAKPRCPNHPAAARQEQT